MVTLATSKRASACVNKSQEVVMTEATPESLESFLGAVLRESWELFKKHALVFVLASIAAALVAGISLGILAGPMFVGLIEVVRRARRGEAVQIGDVFSRFDSFLPSAIALLLIGIAVCIGSFLLVAPGLLAALFSGFVLHAIAYERLTAIDAIKRSFQIVKDHFIQSIALFVSISIAQAIGGAVVLGLLVVMPLSIIAMTLAYERMAASTGSDVAGYSLG
jgi:membrane-anchored glycerophosphoryl diester phosphodiesterase (GDPDase)